MPAPASPKERLALLKIHRRHGAVTSIPANPATPGSGTPSPARGIRSNAPSPPGKLQSTPHPHAHCPPGGCLHPPAYVLDALPHTPLSVQPNVAGGIRQPAQGAAYEDESAGKGEQERCRVCRNATREYAGKAAALCHVCASTFA